MRTLKWLVKENWEILLLFLLPVLSILINQVWMFSNIYVDPWMYFGYFIRLKQYLIAFPFYYGTRLSWILPGYLLHSLFPPLIAHYILHLVLYYIAVFSLYLVLKPHVGKRGAFLASASMGCYSFFLMAVGWDYVDGAGIAYFLMTVLMLSWAAGKENQIIWMALSGVFFGALIYTNLAWLAFLISLITYYVLINYPHRIKKTFISIAAFIVGFLAITILLGVVSYAIGGNLFFFMPSTDFVLSSLSQPHPWINDAHQWLGKPIWLVLPLIVLTGSLAVLSLSKFSKSFEEAALPLQKTFVVTCLIMIFVQITGIASVLQVPFYASYIIPSMFLAIGEVLKSLAMLSKYRFASVATFSLILIVSSLITVDYLFLVVADAQVIVFCLLFMAAVSFSIASSCNQKKIGGILAVLLLTASAIINFNAVWNVNQGVNRLQANALTSKLLSDNYLTVSNVQKLFRDIDPTVSLFNWYPSKDPRESRAYDAIASASLWRNRLIGAEFPSLQPYGFPTSEPLSPQRLRELETLFTMSPKIAIFSQQKDVLQQAINSLKPLGFTAKSIATYPIKQDTISFTITIIGVSKLKDNL